MFNPFKKELFNYKISIVTPSEYTGLMILNAKKELLATVFNKAVRKLKRNEGLHVKGNPEFIEEFEIPERYHKLITTYTEGAFNEVAKEFTKNAPAEHKYQLLTHFVTRCWFERSPTKDWLIKIEISGNHIKK